MNYLYIQVQSSVLELKFLTNFNIENLKSIVLNLTCWPPNDDPNELEIYFKNTLSKREIINKELVFVGDFNINFLDFNESKMVQSIVNLMFWHDKL